MGRTKIIEVHSSKSQLCHQQNVYLIYFLLVEHSACEAGEQYIVARTKGQFGINKMLQNIIHIMKTDWDLTEIALWNPTGVSFECSH